MSAALESVGRSTCADLVTMTVDGQLFGLDVACVRDVLSARQLTAVPHAPREIAGLLNLRGRIVTVLDVRARLSLPPNEGDDARHIVVEHRGELYSLKVDEVGDVLAPTDRRPNPPTMDARWRAVSAGVEQREGRLLIAVDVDRLIGGDSDDSCGAIAPD